MRKRIFNWMALAMVAGLAVSSAAAAADSKVGFIDLQRLVQESKLGRTAAKEIDRLREEKQAELDKMSKEIEALKETLNKKADKMALDEKRDKLQQLQDLNKTYQRMAQDAKEAIERRDKEVVAEILVKAAPVLKKVAEREGYTMILKDKEALAYLAETVNITDEVLAELDKKGK